MTQHNKSSNQSYSSSTKPTKLSTCPLCGKTRIDEGYLVGDFNLCTGHRYEDVVDHAKGKGK
jgi:hypothetical protein